MIWGNTYPFEYARLWRCILFVFAVLFLTAAASIIFSAPLKAAPGINEKLNYQARLLDSTGAVVPDGTYNMEFKIYQDGTGCVGGGTSPCSGTLKWTETRTTTNRVTVTNGYFSIQLGSVTAFGSSVDWNQDTLWLSINVGGTAETPAWDGEMTPFRRLGATPYALNAKQLGGLDWSKFVQVAPSAVQTDGTTLSTLFLNKTGASGNILQLQKNGSDVMVLTNGGALTLQNSTDSVTALRVLNAAGSSVLNVDTTNGRVGIGGIAGVSKFEVIDGEAAIYNNGNNPRLILGDSSAGGENGYLQWDSANNYFRIESVGTNGLKINDNYVAIGNIFPDQPLKIGNGATLLAQVNTTGQVLFQNSTDSANALRVQNTEGLTLLGVDSTRTGNSVANPSLEANTTGWSARSNNCTTFDSYTGGAAPFGNAVLRCATTAVAGNGVNYSVALTANTQYTMSFYINPTVAMSNPNGLVFGYSYNGSDETTNVSSSGTVAANKWLRVTLTFTTPASAPSSSYIFIKQTDATARTLYIDGVQVETGGSASAYKESRLALNGAITSSLLLQPSTDTTTAFSVYSSAGTGVLSVDTVNARVAIGALNPSAKLHVQSSTSSIPTLMVRGASGQSVDIFQVQNSGGTNLVSVGSTGQFTTQNTTDSTTAFRVLNAASTPQFVVDTTNSRAYVGNPTADSTGALLVLDTKNTAGDPTGVNGGMYYNSNSGKFRCYEAGSWKDCIESSPKVGQVVARLRRTTAQTVTSGATTPVTWTTADLDTLSGWSSVTNPSRYTPTVAGYYLLNGGISYESNSTNARSAIWQKNGATTEGGHSQIAASASATTRVPARGRIVSANGTTDYFELSAFQNSGVSLDVIASDAGAEPTMDIIYLGPL